MKKILITLAFFSSLNFVVLSVASAQVTTNTTTDTGSQTQNVTTADLGVENPGLLPTNPFYFIKEWGRGIKMVFTFNPVSKAQYELNIANQKAAELKKVEQLNPDNNQAIQKALDNYNGNLSSLKDRLNNIEQNSDNPAVSNLLTQFTDKVVKQQDLVDQLKTKNPELGQKLDEVQNNINDSIKTVIDKLDTPNNLKERIQKLIQAQPTTQGGEINALDILNRIQGNATNSDVIQKLSELKNDQVKNLEDKIKSGDFSASDAVNILKQLPQPNVDKLKVLNDLKDTTTNIDFKARLQAISPQVTKNAETSLEDLAAKARNIITQAELRYVEIQTKISANAALGAKAGNLLSEIKAMIDVARSALQAGNWADALQKGAKAFTLENILVSSLTVPSGTNTVTGTPTNRGETPRPTIVPKPTTTAPNASVRTGVVCSNSIEQVCGADGKTYKNTCFASVSGVKVISKGECNAGSGETTAPTTNTTPTKISPEGVLKNLESLIPSTNTSTNAGWGTESGAGTENPN